MQRGTFVGCVSITCTHGVGRSAQTKLELTWGLMMLVMYIYILRERANARAPHLRIGTPCVQDAGAPNTYRRAVARTCTPLLYASICKAPTSTSQVGTLFIITHAHARARNTQISMEDLVRPRPRLPGSGLYLEYYSQEQPGATRSSQGAAREQPGRPGSSQGVTWEQPGRPGSSNGG